MAARLAALLACSYSAPPRLSRRDGLGLAAVSIASPAFAANSKPITFTSEDGAYNFRLPNTWTIQNVCAPGQTTCGGRREFVTARRADGTAALEATVDLGEYGTRLSDFMSVDDAANKLLASLPPSASLVSANAETSKSGQTARNYVYVLRLGGGGERIIKLFVQQSRLYMLTLQTDAQPSPELRAELDGIAQTFVAFPVSTLRGGLLRSNAPPTLKPPASLTPTATSRAQRRVSATPPTMMCNDGDTMPRRTKKLSRDPYEIVGVERGASVASVRAAYRKRARELHPDTSGSTEDTTAAFGELVLAFKELMKIEPGSLETHPLWPKLSSLDRYWSRELGYTTAEGLEEWLVMTTKIDDYVDENGEEYEELDPSSLAAEALAKGGSGPKVSEVGAAAAAEEEQEEEEEEISAAGIADVLGYRVFLGNEQWQVSWAEEESERTWERLEVLDTAELRRRADGMRASAEDGG